MQGIADGIIKRDFGEKGGGGKMNSHAVHNFEIPQYVVKRYIMSTRSWWLRCKVECRNVPAWRWV